MKLQLQGLLELERLVAGLGIEDFARRNGAFTRFGQWGIWEIQDQISQLYKMVFLPIIENHPGDICLDQDPNRLPAREARKDKSHTSCTKNRKDGKPKQVGLCGDGWLNPKNAQERCFSTLRGEPPKDGLPFVTK